MRGPICGACGGDDGSDGGIVCEYCAVGTRNPTARVRMTVVPAASSPGRMSLRLPGGRTIHTALDLLDVRIGETVELRIVNAPSGSPAQDEKEGT